MYQDIDEKGKATIEKWVQAGKGVVITHHALATFNNWEWWWKEVSGGRYRLKAEGSTPGSTYDHDQVMNVYPQGNHPVLKGVPPMQLMDEAYKGQWFSPDINILLKTDHPKSDVPVAWISPYKGARVVVIQLGHDRWSHLNPGYRQFVRNAMLWTAGREF
jgi:type 1 glutamine amidotransferase